MLSFIVPAHNEERWIGECLSCIRATMQKVGEPYEVIVVNDASTDATHQIAEQLGARVMRVEHRNISAVRNAGAREAKGQIFFFVDAFGYDPMFFFPEIQKTFAELTPDQKARYSHRGAAFRAFLDWFGQQTDLY